MNKKIMWEFHFDCSDGYLYGLFLATRKEVQDLIQSGRKIYFGEVCGKYSEICGPVEKSDVSVFSDDDYVIQHTEPFGYNPFDYMLDGE